MHFAIPGHPGSDASAFPIPGNGKTGPGMQTLSVFYKKIDQAFCFNFFWMNAELTELSSVLIFRQCWCNITTVWLLISCWLCTDWRSAKARWWFVEWSAVMGECRQQLPSFRTARNWVEVISHAVQTSSSSSADVVVKLKIRCWC